MSPKCSVKNLAPNPRRRSGIILWASLALAATLPAYSQVLYYSEPSVAGEAPASLPPAVGAPPSEAPSPAAPVLPVTPIKPLATERLLWVMPDYSVRDAAHYVPLTSKQKWQLAVKETIDPFNLVNAFIGAASSQRGNQTPKYGEGGAAFGERFGAAIGDFATQNFFSAGVMANLLHQDPRYFRKGPEAKVLPRIWYSLTRVVVARQDSGRSTFNASNFGGMALGILASNAYYPAKSVRGNVMLDRVSTSLFSGVMGNLMSEFVPDLQQKFFGHKRQK